MRAIPGLHALGCSGLRCIARLRNVNLLSGLTVFKGCGPALHTLLLLLPAVYMLCTMQLAVHIEFLARQHKSDVIAGYAGDVWNPQPPPEDHPWRTMPNHGMTPHYSGTTLDAQVSSC